MNYTLKTATERRPVFGWNCDADVMRGDEYLAKVAKDADNTDIDRHIAKLRALGIHPTRAMTMLAAHFPNLVHENMRKDTLIRILICYVDSADEPGTEATGDKAREQSSDGSWIEKYSKTKLRVLKPWQWIMESNQFVHDDGQQFMNDKQFERMFGKLTSKSICGQIDRGKVPMKKFAAQVYIPKSPPVMKYNGRTVFNLWRPSGMAPAYFEDCQWFLDHVAIMFPDPTDRQHLLDYMAQLVQNPEVKIHFAILLQSIEGAGKGALARILRRIIGDRNCVEPSNDDVLSKYTGWQEGVQLAIINELMAEGRTDVLNRLKSPITEDTLRIEKKFGNTFTIPNHMTLFCMTNFKNALDLTEGDRRWLVLFSPASKQPVEYYERLFANIADDDKAAAVMGYLMEHTITFNPKAPAPYTAAKAEMQELAKSDMEADLYGRFETELPPFDVPLFRVSDIVEWVRMENKHARHVHKNALKFLDHIKAVKLRRYKMGKDGLKPYQLYAIRDHAKWMAAEPVAVARAYLAQGSDDEDNDSPTREV